MLDVLIYVFEKHIRSHDGVRLDRDFLMKDLTKAGFDGDQIADALDWLDELNAAQLDTLPPQPHAFRAYQDIEIAKMGVDNIDILIRLERFGILSPLSRELVIDRLMALPGGALAAYQVKCVVLLVLFSDPEGAKALSAMEYFVMKDSDSLGVH